MLYEIILPETRKTLSASGQKSISFFLMSFVLSVLFHYIRIMFCCNLFLICCQTIVYSNALINFGYTTRQSDICQGQYLWVMLRLQPWPQQFDWRLGSRRWVVLALHPSPACLRLPNHRRRPRTVRPLERTKGGHNPGGCNANLRLPFRFSGPWPMAVYWLGYAYTGTTWGGGRSALLTHEGWGGQKG